MSSAKSANRSFEIRDVKVVIFAGSLDFGRSKLASRLPTALWPVFGRPAIVHMLTNLANQGLTRAVICCNDQGSLSRESVAVQDRINLTIMDEPLPRGTAGCIRDAADGNKDELILALNASMVRPPRIETFLRNHKNDRSDLTVLFEPVRKMGEPLGRPAEIYLCEPAVLDHVPKQGYYDLKETLIPALMRAGKDVRVASLQRCTGCFRDEAAYLQAVAEYLVEAKRQDVDLPFYARNGSRVIWQGTDTEIDPSVQIRGPVIIMDGACVSKGALVIGPTVLGRNVSIGTDSVVVNSIMWDNAKTGANCKIQRCVIDYDAVLPNYTFAQGKSFAKPERPLGRVRTATGKNAGKTRSAVQPQFTKINDNLLSRLSPHKRSIIFGLVFAALLWSYWPGIVELWNIWQISDEYSCGLLVPFLAVYILWSRRRQLATVPTRPSLWGLPALLAAQSVRFFGVWFMYGSAERLSIVLSLAAVVLLLFGRQLFRNVSGILLFLCLMLPWPNRIHTAVALPLQRWATFSAAFCLETIGFDVVQEGNIIHIGDVSVAVAEACNGLRMITAFFVISGLLALLVRRAWWEKLIVIVSSLPIAILCNAARLSATALALTMLGGAHWEKLFHSFGGYVMMPLGLAIVVAELWLLKKLTTSPAVSIDAPKESRK